MPRRETSPAHRPVDDGAPGAPTPARGRKGLAPWIAGVAVLLAVIGASGGVFRAYERADVDRGRVLVYGGIGAMFGAVAALAARRAIRRRSSSDDLSTKDSSKAVTAMLVSLCAIAAITVVPHSTSDGPEVDSGPDTTVIASPPTSDGPPASAPPPERRRSDEDVGSALMGMVIALGLAAIVAIMLTYRGRPRAEPRLAPFDQLPEIPAETRVDDRVAAESIANSIRILSDGDDARRAVVAAYATLLDGLAAAGAPRAPHEAPEEHLRRALDALSIPGHDAETLTRLFVLARFSTHPVTAADRTRAIEALRAAERQLREREVRT